MTRGRVRGLEARGPTATELIRRAAAARAAQAAQQNGHEGQPPRLPYPQPVPPVRTERDDDSAC